MKRSARSLLLTGLAVVVATVCWASDTQIEVEKSPSTLGLVEWYASQGTAIAYSKNAQPLPEGVATFCQSLVDFEVQTMKEYGLSPYPTPTAPTTWQTQESRKAAFWQKICQAWPSRQFGQYSHARYEHFMAWDLPRLMAPYGIHVRLLFGISGNYLEPQLRAFEAKALFYPVLQVEQRQLSMWGQNVTQPIVWIGDPMWIDNYPELKSLFKAAGGQAYYQTIFLYKPDIEKVIPSNLSEEQKNSRRNVTEKIGPLRQADVTERVIRAKDPYVEAIAWSLDKVSYDKINPGETFEIEEARIVAHEARHAMEMRDTKLREARKPLLTTLLVPNLCSDNSLVTNFEIDGTLSELRYAKLKAEPLRYLLRLKRNEGIIQDYPHSQAGRWVLAKMVELARTKPERYGITFRPTVALSKESQFYLLLPDLPSKALELMADDMMAIHLKTPAIDFSEEFLNSQKRG
jgi:hypothetical protein